MPDEPDHSGGLSAAATWRVRIVLILALFAIEKVIEEMIEHRYGEPVKQKLAAVDDKMREELKELSPRFLLEDFRDGLAIKSSGSAAPTALPSPSAYSAEVDRILNKDKKPAPSTPTAAEEIAKEFQRQKAADLLHPERVITPDTKVELAQFGKDQGTAVAPAGVVPATPGASPQPGSAWKPPGQTTSTPDHPSPAAQDAMNLANETTAPPPDKGSLPRNPLIFIARVPGAIMHMLGEAGKRGALHFVLAALVLTMGWYVVRPDKARRWWLLVLVPVVGSGIAWGLYYLCGYAEITSLTIPSLPTVGAVAFGLGKVPFNMVIEKWVHHGLVSIARLVRSFL